MNPRFFFATLKTLSVIASVFAAALLLSSTPAYANTYYVAPNGLASNPGTWAAPLDLATALSAQSPAQPGDTIWLRGGLYRPTATVDAGGHDVLYVSYLNGTAGAPIIVRQYPGERATLDGGLAPTVPVLVVNGSYTYFWGFEVTNTNLDRLSVRADGIDMYGDHNKFINLIIHDTGEGIGFWATNVPDDSEISGCLIYNVGYDRSDRGHGHSIYVQNIGGTKKIDNNILFDSFGFGIHAYTENGHIDNLSIEGNIAFNAGLLSAVSGPEANVLFLGNNPPQNASLLNNYTYFTNPSPGRGIDMNFCNNATIQNNFLVGGLPLNINHCTNSVITGNTIYGAWDSVMHDTYPNNLYSVTPTGVAYGVRPNVYEPGRANIVIYNWNSSNQTSVDVDLSGSGLAIGDAYELRDAENYLAGPILTGTFNGHVVIPMTGLSAAAPIGTNAPIIPPHTAPAFGVFVIERPSSGPPPTATFAASPTSIAISGSSTLSWSTSGTTSVSIDNNIGLVGPSGSLQVSPSSTTTYTLTATNANATITTTATVSVSSTDGTLVPPASQIMDTTGALWTIGANQQILRNGSWVGGGTGLKILWFGGSIYVLGSDGSHWWKWGAGAWSNVGTTQPGIPTSAPPGTPTSADGTLVPPAPQIVDATGGLWTINPAGAILLNGSSAGGGSGLKILWLSSTIYVLGGDGSHWWKWASGGWTNVGTTQPGTSSTPTTPPAGGGTTPPTTSADNTLLPPAPQIVDANGGVWTISSSSQILLNGGWVGGGTGTKILWFGGAIYVLGGDGSHWWKWASGGWTNVGTTQPGSSSTPTTPPAGGGTPPTTSPDGTVLPPAPQIVDANGGVWTISPTQLILLNGGSAGGGTGLKILWLTNTIYVLGSDGSHWWKWSGGGWSNVGTTQPGGSSTPTTPPSDGTTPPTTPPTTSADNTLLPPAPQIVDASGGVWTINSSHQILLNGNWAGGGTGLEILWVNSTIYALGSDGTHWWKWGSGGWTGVGTTQPTSSSTPTTPPSGGTASASGTDVPQTATQIVDAAGAVWTIATNQQILRNGAWAAGGTGFQILWLNGTIYVLGSDNSNWWKWVSGVGTWVPVGTTRPLT
jgi:hypothetical protein